MWNGGQERKPGVINEIKHRLLVIQQERGREMIAYS